MNRTDGKIAGLLVSRETIEMLHLYADLLIKWNHHINLVSESTIKNLWSRHIEDSAQIFKLVPNIEGNWADLGSGGGFPGLVIAILAQVSNPKLQVTLVESDVRKAIFLRTVIRECKLSVRVITDRIEALPSLQADIVSARALAELSQLLHFADRHLRSDGTALFQKGASWRKELAAVDKSWSFQLEHFRSVTEPEAVILMMRGIKHA
ncbi:MAG: 16S rRNA (guanine(527)-N(7))-methyltransferase RsmG [Paracoccaceae bacterium]|nr:16S rRNA (guanine(527)-N(7))-methyltransferase RsmG [Paracoccaceae bacterium]